MIKKLNFEKNSFLLLFDLYRFLSFKRKTQLLISIFSMVIGGFAEIIALGSIIPFIEGLIDPNSLFQNQRFLPIVRIFNLKNDQNFIIVLAVCFFCAFLFSSFLRLINIWFPVKLSALIGYDFSCKIYQNNLFQDYLYHIRQNSSELITRLVRNIEFTILSINYLLGIITSAILALSLFTIFAIVNLKICLILVILLANIYFLLGFNLKRILLNNSKIIKEGNNLQVRNVQESSNLIKEILVLSNQANFVEKYRKVEYKIRSKFAENFFLGAFPRTIVEAIAIMVVILISLINKSMGASTQENIALIGFIALGSQRLLPVIQSMYFNWSGILANRASIEDVLNSLFQEPNIVELINPNTELSFDKSIEFQNVDFGFKETNLVVENLSFTISKGDRVGILGKTGSGKSTILNLILCLIKPKSGKILVDGDDIYSDNYPSSIKKWRNNM